MIHIMLPAQCVRRARLAEPHKRLIAAVLQAVVDDCRGGSVYRRSASTDRTWPFSFENLCDALELDAVALRRELIAVQGPA